MKHNDNERDDGDRYAYYDFNDLKRLKIVSSRPGLHFLQKHKGFPKPTIKRGKSIQAAALWKRCIVHDYLDREEQETAAE
jgi:hypothetical protein